MGLRGLPVSVLLTPPPRTSLFPGILPAFSLGAMGLACFLYTPHSHLQENRLEESRGEEIRTGFRSCSATPELCDLGQGI